MRLVEMRGGYLYQHCPDIAPHGYLTPEEVFLWAAFNERRTAEDASHG